LLYVLLASLLIVLLAGSLSSKVAGQPEGQMDYLLSGEQSCHPLHLANFPLADQ